MGLGVCLCAVGLGLDIGLGIKPAAARALFAAAAQYDPRFLPVPRPPAGLATPPLGLSLGLAALGLATKPDAPSRTTCCR